VDGHCTLWCILQHAQYYGEVLTTTFSWAVASPVHAVTCLLFDIECRSLRCRLRYRLLSVQSESSVLLDVHSPLLGFQHVRYCLSLRNPPEQQRCTTQKDPDCARPIQQLTSEVPLRVLRSGSRQPVVAGSCLFRYNDIAWFLPL
jgi:hypothetical protein